MTVGWGPNTVGCDSLRGCVTRYLNHKCPYPYSGWATAPPRTAATAWPGLSPTSLMWVNRSTDNRGGDILITIFQGIGVLGVVFCGFLLIGTVYAFGCPKNYGGYDYPGFIDEDRRCPGPEFPIKKLNTAIIASIYFVSFWILPSYLLLKGLKEENLKKFLPWILSMLFHPILFFIFNDSGFVEELRTPMLLSLIPQVIIWTVAGNMCRWLDTI